MGNANDKKVLELRALIATKKENTHTKIQPI
jgi:hypothetical protein